MTPPTNDHSAASITGRAFDVRRKGFDPDEVRAYLGQLAEVVQRLTAERDEARAQVRDLRAEAEARPAIDEDQLTAALGEETARVLTSARRAAVEMKERAEESVAQMLREAAEAAGATRRDAEAAAARKVEEAERVRAEVDEERARVEAELAEETTRVRAELEAEATAAREAIETDRTAAAEAAREAAEAADAAAAAVRAEADEVLATRTAEAEEAAAAIRAAAEAAAVEIRQAADDDAAGSRATGESEREALQEEGKAMVAEAQRVRERMLADLSRRRKAARVQLEQLQAARDRLLESYDAVQRTLDEATSGLRRALPDARAAADSARIRVEAEPDTTVDELEAQIAAARDAGLPLVAADGDATGAAAAAGDAADAGPALEVVADVDAPSTDGSGVPGDSGDDVDDRVVAGPDPASVVDSEPVTEEVPVVADDASLDEPPADGAEVEELFARLKASRGEAADDAAEAASDAAGDAAGDAAVEADAPDDPVDLTAAEDASDEPPVASDAGEGVDDEAGGSGPEGDLLGLIGRRDGALEPIESRVARRLKRALADEQGRVLDGVRRQAGSSGLDDLLPLDAQVAAFAEAVGADLHAAAEEGAAFEGAALPTSVSVDVLADELGRSLAGVVRPRVERCFDDGEDADDLSDRLRTTYREWKTDALVEATRHVVLAAFGVGQQAVRPAGTPVRWVPDPGHPPCPDCEDDALAGALPSGEAFPTGHAHPPAHPGCRCLVVGEPVAALA